MRYEDMTRAAIRSLPVYQPGLPVEVLAREYGLKVDTIVKLASNENPLGPSPMASEAIAAGLGNAHFYPDNGGFSLVHALAERHRCQPEAITLAAGSNEIFYLLADVFLEPGLEVVMGAHAFISYRIASLLAGATIVDTPMPGLVHDLDAMMDAVTEKTRIVFLPNPNNPTGTALPVADVEAFVRALPDHVLFCYDEAYAEYEDEHLDVTALISEGFPILATRTFSKIHGLAGLRMGYSFSDPALAEQLNRVRPPFNTGNLAQAAALAALADAAWLERSRQVNAAGAVQLRTGLHELGLEVSGGHGNFLLFSLENASGMAQSLQEMGIIIRPLAGYGLPRHLRVSIGTEEQNGRFLEALGQCLARG